MEMDNKLMKKSMEKIGAKKEIVKAFA